MSHLILTLCELRQNAR